MTAFELTEKTRQLLRGPLKHVRKAALATALVPLGAVALPHTANAQFFPENTSRVDATVTPVVDGFLYEFTVRNTSFGGGATLTDEPVATSIGTFVIVDWELPLFSLDDIDLTSIQSPFGWNYEIVEPPYLTEMGVIWSEYDSSSDPLLDPLQGGDPDLYGPNPEAFENPPYVLHWFDDPSLGSGSAEGIFPGGFLSGFSFESEYSSRNAPYLASWSEQPPRGGDPPIPGGLGFGSPNSPARQAAQGIPEPSSLVLLVMAGIPLLSRGRDENR